MSPLRMPVLSFAHYFQAPATQAMKLIKADVSEIYKKVLKVQILNEVALIHVVRKRVSFQDSKNEKNQNFLASKYDIKQHSDAT